MTVSQVGESLLKFPLEKLGQSKGGVTACIVKHDIKGQYTGIKAPLELYDSIPESLIFKATNSLFKVKGVLFNISPIFITFSCTILT